MGRQHARVPSWRQAAPNVEIDRGAEKQNQNDEHSSRCGLRRIRSATPEAIACYHGPMIFAIGFGAILALAAIANLMVRRRGKAFYSEGTSDGSWSVNERLTRFGSRSVEDDTFNRKYR